MRERLYTLEQAKAELARQECIRLGHEWLIVSMGGDTECSRCWAKNEARDWERRIQVAYERGWRDACDDHLQQRGTSTSPPDPAYPIGGRKQRPYVERFDQ